MHQKGSVFFKKGFEFKDGDSADKLLVLLNTPTGKEDCLFVKTTSQASSRVKKIGCGKHPSYNQGEFFISSGTSVFKADTWIVLYEIYQIPITALPAGYSKKGVLSDKLVSSILDCLFLHHDEDISELHEQWLRPPLQASRLKLQEWFNNR